MHVSDASDQGKMTLFSFLCIIYLWSPLKPYTIFIKPIPFANQLINHHKSSSISVVSQSDIDIVFHIPKAKQDAVYATLISELFAVTQMSFKNI